MRTTITSRIPVLALTALLLAAPIAAAERQTPPEGGPPRDFKLPETTDFTLDNGMRVTLVPYGQLPKVTARVVVRSGNLNESADQVWLADLTADLIQEGAGDLDAVGLAEAFAAIGGELSINVGADTTGVGGEALADYAPRLVELLADVARRPTLPDSELERLKGDMVRNLTIALSQPQPLADRRFAELIAPDHPYGRLFPTEEMIRGYGIDDVRGFYQSNFGARRSHLFVVGRFDAKAVETAVRAGFGDWVEGPEPLVLVPEMHTERKVHLIDRPGAPQSTLRIGLPVSDPSQDDYTRLQVTNTLLGGFFSSRITSNIREDKGYTYSPSSQIETRYRAAVWVQNADVTTSVTGPAIGEIFKEIGRLATEAPPEDELRGVQSYMAGLFVLQNSSRGGIINQLAFLDLHGLDKSYLTGFVDRVYAVTPEDVRKTAGELLDAGRMTIVVVGDRSAIQKQLKPFGPIVD